MTSVGNKTSSNGVGGAQPCRSTVFQPFDPECPFGTTGDRKAKWMWILVAGVAALSFLALWRANLQFGRDGRNYLLSSTAQVLAAVAALSVTLPLAFASLSDYLPSFGERIVASFHFRGFVTLFAGTIAFSLVLLCFASARELLLVTAVAAAIGCLAGVVPYFIWIADRTNPQRHLDGLLSRADAIVRRHETITNLVTLAGPANDVQESLGLMTQIASVATFRGTSSYLSDALIGVLMFWLKYDVRGVGWAADRGREAWGNFMVTNADNYLAVGTAGECASRIFVRQCWQGSMRPSARVFGDVAELLISERIPQDAGRIVAVRGCWRLGVVAQHTEPNGEGARAVAHQIAVTQLDISEENLTRVSPVFEDHVSEWFRMFADTDSTPELAGFRMLVVEEHTALRRRLDIAGS
jgi:hypothetical protein